MAGHLKNKLHLVGNCLATNLKNAAKVQVKKLVLDEYLHMYFPIRRTLFAYDKDQITKPGDVVLIKKLQTQLTKEITHEVVEVVYPLGEITDPLTGRKVHGMEYEDQADRMYTSVGGDKMGYLKHKLALKQNEEKPNALEQKETESVQERS